MGVSKQFQDWLRQDVEQSGLTYADYGKLIGDEGVTHVTVSNWVNGRHVPNALQLRWLAEARGVKPEFLFQLVGYLPSDGNESGQLPAQTREMLMYLEGLEQDDLVEIASVVRTMAESRKARRKVS